MRYFQNDRDHISQNTIEIVGTECTRIYFRENYLSLSMMASELLTLHATKSTAIAGMTVVLAGAVAAANYASRFDKTPQHTSKLTGQGWVDELMNGHSRRFYNQLGLHKHVFERLVLHPSWIW